MFILLIGVPVSVKMKQVLK